MTNITTNEAVKVETECGCPRCMADAKAQTTINPTNSATVEGVISFNREAKAAWDQDAPTWKTQETDPNWETPWFLRGE